MRFGACVLGPYGRAFLLGTSALVMMATPAVADFDITVDTAANQVLDANETGTVQAGATLSPSDTALPTVDIIGSGATLTNDGTIVGGSSGAVRASGVIDSVTLTNIRTRTSTGR